MTLISRLFKVDVLSDNDNFIKFKEAMEQLSIRLAKIPKSSDSNSNPQSRYMLKTSGYAEKDGVVPYVFTLINLEEIDTDVAGIFTDFMTSFNYRSHTLNIGVESDKTIYHLWDNETGEIVHWNVKQIVEDINRDRSNEWEDYNELDWKDGLEDMTNWVILSHGLVNNLLSDEDFIMVADKVEAECKANVPYLDQINLNILIETGNWLGTVPQFCTALTFGEVDMSNAYVRHLKAKED